jgi:hypothetical protein
MITSYIMTAHKHNVSVLKGSLGSLEQKGETVRVCENLLFPSLDIFVCTRLINR